MSNEKVALWPLKKWSPYARIVDGKPHGYMIGDKQGKWCFAESAEKQIHALQAEVDALKAEVAGLRDWEECAKQLDRAKLPCGHNARYANTEDGGKHGFCTLCEVARLKKENFILDDVLTQQTDRIAELKAEVARLSAPVTGAEAARAEYTFDASPSDDEKEWWRAVLEDFRRARATPPQDVEKS